MVRIFFYARVMYQTFSALCVYAQYIRVTHTHTHTTQCNAMRTHVHVQARIYVVAYVMRRVLMHENGKSLSIFHGLFKPKTKSFSNFHGLFTYLVRLVVSCSSDIMNLSSNFRECFNKLNVIVMEKCIEIIFKIAAFVLVIAGFSFLTYPVIAAYCMVVFIVLIIIGAIMNIVK